jgi:hypothetical protein
MAASQPVLHNIFYYTRRPYHRIRQHPDLVVPRRLLSRAGLKHHIINMPPAMSEEFADVFRANLDTPHDAWGIMAEGESRGLPAEIAVVWGTVSEVGRPYYWEGGIASKVTPDLLARVATGLGLRPSHDETLSGCERQFTLDAFGEWLSGAHFGEGLQALDMFAWEQVAGSWAAMWNDEVAIAHETLPLFNCRDFLTTLLSVDEQYRRAPNSELHYRMINHMWAEGLSEPFNPPVPLRSFCERSVDAVKSLVRRSVPDPAVALSRRLIRALRGI